MAQRRNRYIEADMAGLKTEVGGLRQAVEKSNDSLAEVREGFQRLRGEINGSLPRIEEKVERVIGQLNDRQEVEREYFEKVQVHESEIEILFRQVGKKADAAANSTEHGRLWLAIRLFLAGTLMALIGLLLTKLLT